MQNYPRTEEEKTDLPPLDNLVDDEGADKGGDGDEGRGVEPGQRVKLVLLRTCKKCFQTKKLASLKATLVGIYDPVSESVGHRVEGS